ncbi:MAG: APC family permease [Anaerolineales bacterium]|nr:MAG: APC family permease [Anaerolineales bacterium]
MRSNAFSIRRLLLGDPMASSQLIHEKISKAKALAVFSSDALSSVAYASEEILFVLAAAGTAYLRISLPISGAIALLLLIVGFSYYQTIHAYPSSGGAYIVAKDNLGTPFALVAGASLLIDYTLTVAVSISAGVSAITSWLPELVPLRLVLGVIAVAIVTLINLRGVRESATIFAIPTYMFISGIMLLIGYGLVQWLIHGSLPTITVNEPVHADIAVQGITLFFLLRAFSAGCTALTGIEAISNGVPAFQPPAADNAGKTLLAMVTLLGMMFLGISFLANQIGAAPSHTETVLSQIGRALFGSGPLYIGVQVATALILLLAANTAFADFPRLSSFMANDRFLPRQMGNLGDRLVYSNGITLLGILASVLIIIFEGDTHRLLPLYAVGVFLSFTLSQTGMVRRWLRLRSKGWRRNAFINIMGAIATCTVFLIILTTRFLAGAWIVLVLIALFSFVFLRIHTHYGQIAKALSLDAFGSASRPRVPVVVIPIGGVHRGVLKALEFARSLSPDVTAVHVETSEEEGDKLRHKWEQWGDGVRLITLKSPYRSIVSPLIQYLNQVREERQRDDIITVVLPQFVPAHWWENLLHGQSAWLIRLGLLFREGYIVIDVPYHINEMALREKLG